MIAHPMAWLVVGREKDQSMMIGDGLRVTVLRVRGQRALVVTSRRRAWAADQTDSHAYPSS